MATRQEILATTVPFTITLASLASGSARESLVYDNSASLYLDVHVHATCVLATGSPSGDAAIYFYAYSIVEDGVGGSFYSDNATGADAALTMRNPTNLKPIYVLGTPTAGGLTYRTPAIPLVPAFGFVPRKFGIVVENKSGLALASSGNFAAFTGYKEQIQ